VGRKGGGGHIPLSLVIEVFRGVCIWCGGRVNPDAHPFDGDAPTREHLIHLSRGGKGARCNLALACYDCNNGRGDADVPAGVDLTVVVHYTPAHRAAVGVLRAETPEERDRAEQDLIHQYELAASRLGHGERERAKEQERRQVEELYRRMRGRSPRGASRRYAGG
jgi:hypothetical protein